MATYVSKVTSAGQVTIPKAVRKTLAVDEDDYVEFTQVGDAVVIRKLEARRDRIKAIREKVRRTGLTKDRVEAIVEETREGMWRRRR